MKSKAHWNCKIILHYELIQSRLQPRLQQNSASIKAWLSINSTFTASYGGTRMNLYFAAWTGDREILQMLVREGEDVTMQDSYGWTALHLAVWNMHTDIVRFLLQ